ncbi:putative site-specific recombinase [Oscillibacter valericigenes Sjm18-20]|nr:putative site-specific recombinase [Oscillibacter valericigenes Sjm18-20]
MMRCNCAGLSPGTVEWYLGRLKLFLKYFNDRLIEEMGEIEIREYLLYLLDFGYSTRSVNVCNSALRFIFAAVVGWNLNYQLIYRRCKY